MKITIAFYPEEAQEAYLLVRAARGILDVDKVRESERHPPVTHIYITSRKPENLCNAKENT